MNHNRFDFDEDATVETFIPIKKGANPKRQEREDDKRKKPKRDDRRVRHATDDADHRR